MSKSELNDDGSVDIAALQIEPALPGVGKVMFTVGLDAATAGLNTSGAVESPAMPASTFRRVGKRDAVRLLSFELMSASRSL
ncbi:hypothetical protein [Tardiphaga sp.]|uniref:hypothetical protein n=1 Tax=Tardiphaga sp. TaxID=1926292 RepID=UPI00260CA17C|nr:hypothetical protein [Tardiphaga sp.]